MPTLSTLSFTGGTYSTSSLFYSFASVGHSAQSSGSSVDSDPDGLLPVTAIKAVESVFGQPTTYTVRMEMTSYPQGWEYITIDGNDYNLSDATLSSGLYIWSISSSAYNDLTMSPTFTLDFKFEATGPEGRAELLIVGGESAIIVHQELDITISEPKEVTINNDY